MSIGYIIRPQYAKKLTGNQPRTQAISLILGARPPAEPGYEDDWQLATNLLF